MKKILALLIAFALLISCAGCSFNDAMQSFSNRTLESVGNDIKNEIQHIGHDPVTTQHITFYELNQPYTGFKDAGSRNLSMTFKSLSLVTDFNGGQINTENICFTTAIGEEIIPTDETKTSFRFDDDWSMLIAEVEFLNTSDVDELTDGLFFPGSYLEKMLGDTRECDLKYEKLVSTRRYIEYIPAEGASVATGLKEYGQFSIRNNEPLNVTYGFYCQNSEIKEIYDGGGFVAIELNLSDRSIVTSNNGDEDWYLNCIEIPREVFAEILD